MSRTFQWFAIPCILAYFVLRPDRSRADITINFSRIRMCLLLWRVITVSRKGPKQSLRLVWGERRTANAKEMGRLAAWAESFHGRKRDLLK